MAETVVGVITCKQTWTAGMYTYAYRGRKYRIVSKREDGLFFESEAGLKWVSREDYPLWFVSSSDEGIDLSDPEILTYEMVAREVMAEMGENDRRVMSSLMNSMAMTSVADAKRYEEADEREREHMSYLADSAIHAQKFESLAAIFSREAEEEK